MLGLYFQLLQPKQPCSGHGFVLRRMRWSKAAPVPLASSSCLVPPAFGIVCGMAWSRNENCKGVVARTSTENQSLIFLFSWELFGGVTHSAVEAANAACRIILATAAWTPHSLCSSCSWLYLRFVIVVTFALLLAKLMRGSTKEVGGTVGKNQGFLGVAKMPELNLAWLVGSFIHQERSNTKSFGSAACSRLVFLFCWNLWLRNNDLVRGTSK